MTHNMPVTVERDVLPLPSIRQPRDVTDAKQQASHKAGFLSFRERFHSMTGPGINPADTAVTGEPSVTAKPRTIREFEAGLLTLGFSKRESKAVASGGFKAIHPTEQLTEQMSELMAALAKNITLFESNI